MSQESITEHMFPIVESEELITEWSQQIEESLNTDNKDAFLVWNLIEKSRERKSPAAKVESNKQETASHKAKRSK